MIDAHAHFEFYKKEVPQVIEECRKELKAVVDSITEYRKTHVWKSWELLKPYFGFLFPTLGYHPNEARRGNWEKVKRVEDFIREHRNEIVAVGEIGLDYHYAENEAQRENQRAIFQHFLELAVELKLPVVIHARDAEREAFELVQRYGVNAYFHSFTGSPELAKEIAENDHPIGISTGIVFIPEIRKTVEALELEDILVETDSPYMSPFKGQRNKPYYVRVAIEEVAKLKGLEFGEVERITEKNTIEFFRLEV
ncbi:YchF/TatD family DNA exonuclease [Thermococcus sp. GR7]|uniref:YchF/TatD family DNA exonuclease n=1 Tax=unclassified Thermococcus TaxID=2627626 RepID=UPI00142F4EBF|nr:YchF/TatD family DNA exonuclease [Thermococcus sp. GR7]NJE79560.1 YchF/TatD family DNA exonuclease [Thermococcus sp. GR4]NJF22459.1 YchF/TatD family DNA exonuclease [Thermococcus sp. GR5]